MNRVRRPRLSEDLRESDEPECLKHLPDPLNEASLRIDECRYAGVDVSLRVLLVRRSLETMEKFGCRGLIRQRVQAKQDDGLLSQTL